jgi:ubiquinone/menaquinone biosynthesis C-methylase UbiE
MDSSQEVFEKIRQQYDSTPYPRAPLDYTPKSDYNNLFIHSLVTPYYLKYQKVVDTTNTLILDAGCGSGVNALTLAWANPGARIVGVDISAESIDLAKQRLNHHGFTNCEFHTLSILDLPSLGMEFDYINCDETLYFWPDRDPSQGLKAFKSVLKPTGIIRTNLHSALQRASIYRAQALFKLMGLYEENPGELEAEVVIETMKALKDQVQIKAQTWQQDYERSDSRETIFMNFLIQGDQGFTIPEVFAALQTSELEFLSMVKWREWELLELFKDSKNLPAVWAMSLPELDMQDRLHVFELLNPVHRLLDFWCSHPNTPMISSSVAQWSDADWERSVVHLHPLLRTETVKADLIEALHKRRNFEISRYITATVSRPILVDSSILSCLVELWDGAQPFTNLLKRWQALYPLDPVTLEPQEVTVGFGLLRETLTALEAFLYVLLEQV